MNEPVSVRPDEFDYDVIVVGSGIAGLSAAYNIIQKDPGVTVLVLEGSGKFSIERRKVFANYESKY